MGLNIVSVNRFLFLLAAITGLVASISAFSSQSRWILIVVMVAAWAFFFTFLTVCMFRVPGPPSRWLTAALFFFASGAFGNFIVSLDIYLLDPSTPYFGYLRNSVVNSSALGAGAILLLIDAISHPPPLTVIAVFTTIILSVTALLTSSVLSYQGSVIGGKVGNVVGFGFLLLSAIFNLF